jgi:hypothetical protein
LINVPAVLVALVAVVALMPESRSAHRPRVDGTGVLLSSAGLIGLTYGVIAAGRDGWGNPAALATMIAGIAVLAVFTAWERRVSRLGPARQPLVDLTLFRSASFTWGAILTTLVSFALFGILFAMPQYFRDIRGFDSLSSGIRLLPILVGMMAGIVVGTRLQRTSAGPAGRPVPPMRGTSVPHTRAPNTKTLVAAGFTLIAAALATGATTSTASGTGFGAAWFALLGFGLGLAMPAAMNAALGALSAERSGVGSAVLSAMRQVGATIGVAVLGTVLSSVYRSRLDVAGVPTAVADVARGSLAGGMAVARQTSRLALLGSVRTAFVQAMDVMLWVCGGIAVTAVILALAFLPRRGEAAPGVRDEARATSEIGA